MKKSLEFNADFKSTCCINIIFPNLQLYNPPKMYLLLKQEIHEISLGERKLIFPVKGP